MAIQIRRGTDAQWEAGKRNIVVGEPAITTDTERAFIGTGSGTYVELATIGDTDVTITDIKDNAFIHRTESGSIASFSDGSDMNAEELIADINPIQSGSGEPSPTNVRPISGWDSVDVNVVGKNLLPNEAVSGSASGITWVKNADGSITVNGTATGNYNIPIYGTSSNDLKPFPYSDKSITVSGCPSGGGASSFRMGGYLYKDGVYTGRGIIDTGGTLTVSGVDFNQIYFVLFLYSGYTYNNVTFYPMVEYGTTATTYVPYNGNTTTVSLGQTVYGASLNVTTGVLTINMGYVDLGTLTWTYYAYNDHSGGYSNSINSNTKRYVYNELPNAICSALSPLTDSAFNNNTGSNFTINANGLLKATVPNVTDSATLKSALSGVYLAYELATPTTVQLTPTEVSTLLGQNNVWADSGDVEVTYTANASLTIEEIINAITALGGNV